MSLYSDFRLVPWVDAYSCCVKHLILWSAQVSDDSAMSQHDKIQV